MLFQKNTTSRSIWFFVCNSSGPMTGLDASDLTLVAFLCESGIRYRLSDALHDIASPTSDFTAGGVVEDPGIGAGFYRVDIPDSWFGVAGCGTIRLEAAGSINPPLEFGVVEWNPATGAGMTVESCESVTETVQANLIEIIGAAVTEVNAGSVATNLAYFFDMASPIDFTVQNLSNAIDNAHPDSLEVEAGITMTEALKAIAAATAGVSTDDGNTFQAIGNDATTRITASVDGDGNRTSVNLSL